MLHVRRWLGWTLRWDGPPAPDWLLPRDAPRPSPGGTERPADSPACLDPYYLDGASS